MRSIKKLKSTGKAVAGSALLVGATLTGAAGLAAAQDSGSMDLGDYPQPFVDEDGEVDTTIVVGDQAQTADVVGAINVAGSLGNAAFMEEEVNVDVSGAVASWTAENGVTLNRRNSNIFFGEGTATEQVRFDEEDISSLETTTVRSEDNEEVEIEHDLRVGDQSQAFNSNVGDVDDPLLHVKNPTNPTVDSDYLLQAEVEFDQTMDFSVTSTDSKDADADEVLEDGDELELFGQEYTYSDESTSSELVLYGSSERFEVNTGESTTITVDGEEHTFAAEYVNDGGSPATITVDGNTESVEEGDTVTVSNQDVRISDIYRTGPDGKGRVAFSIGSQELTITDNEVEVNGNTVDGVDVQLDDNGNNFADLDGVKLAFGAQDSDQNYVGAGEKYETPLFGLEFHYGGLAPNAAEGTSDTVTVDAEDDSDVELDFSVSGGEEVSVKLGEVDNGNFNFGPGTDGETFAQYEGQKITEDDYTILNQNEESAMVEVTNVDDTDLEDANGDDESVSVSLRNPATGESMTVEEDGLDFSGSPGSDDRNSDGSYTLESESIEGMDYDVTWHTGDEVSFERTTDSDTQLWPHMYTNTNAAVAVDAPGTIDLSNVFDITGSDFGSVALSSAEDSSDNSNDDINVTANSTDASGNSGTVEFYNQDGEKAGSVALSNVIGSNAGDNSAVVTLSNDSQDSTIVESVAIVNADGYDSDVTIHVNGNDANAAENGSNATVDPTASADATRAVDLPSGVASNDATATVTFTNTTEHIASATINEDFVQYSLTTTGSEIDLANTEDDTAGSAATLVVEPEDDRDEEQAYVIEGYADDGSQSVDVDYTGSTRETDSLDDEDVTVGYDFYGAYSELDTEDSSQHTFNLHLPGSQSTAGMAVTGTDGTLSASGSSSGSATTQTPTGWPDAGALDTEVSGSDKDQNMILVGGPAVNTLTEELAQDNKTWTADQYDEDTWVLDLVEGFSDDTHALVVAGHSADDTRAASSFISNYADNADELAGETTVSMTTSASQ